VPLDGSPLAERALGCAVPIARATGARLVLVRASGTRPDDETWSEELALSRARDDLRATAAWLAREGIAADPVVRAGDASRTILDVARERAVDLVAMGTHGRSVGDQWRYGSVADEVIRRGAGLPILLVPASCSLAHHADRPRIIVLLDGSSFAEQILPSVGELARGMAGSVVLLRADEPAEPTAESYLREVASTAALRSVAVEVRVEPSEVGLAISTTERAVGGADVVAMATHGRTGLGRALMGSVAASVLRTTTCPVLVLRPVGLHGDEDSASGRERGA
jgi:nucleotide-binding universal stress UspA family protein